MQKVPEIIGSWYNTGYHGHFRSKARSDVMDLYRQLAKPCPPHVFNRRIQEETTNFPFTHHDNRALIHMESEGLGKKKVKGGSRQSHEDLLTWWPYKEEYCREGPMLSTYGHQFRGVPPDVDGLKQKLVDRMRLTIDRPGVTTYRFSHGHDNPHRRTPSPVTKNRLMKTPDDRATVAACLNWYRPPKLTPFVRNPSCCPPPEPVQPTPECRVDPSLVVNTVCGQIPMPPCHTLYQPPTECLCQTTNAFDAQHPQHPTHHHPHQQQPTPPLPPPCRQERVMGGETAAPDAGSSSSCCGQAPPPPPPPTSSCGCQG